MSNKVAARGLPPMNDWGQSLKSLDAYIQGLENSTGRFGGEETLRCQACGRWVETVRVQFSLYTGEPLCPGCAESEATGA